MIYMKGIPKAPRCGFNVLAVRVLNEYIQESYLSYLYFLGYIYLFLLTKWGNTSLFRYA